MAKTDAEITAFEDGEKKSGDEVQSLGAQALLLQHERAFLESNGEKNKSLFKPSRFKLLDFDQEATRLESCLRQSR